MFDTIAELNAAKGIFGFWELGGVLRELDVTFEDVAEDVVVCGMEGDFNSAGEAREADEVFFVDWSVVWEGVASGVFFAAFALLLDCVVAFVDSSRTCSRIFEVFGVTTAFVRATCDSGIVVDDAIAAVGIDLEVMLSAACKGWSVSI